MAINIGSRFKQAWNIFMNRDPTPYVNYGQTSYYRPDRRPPRIRNQRTLVAAIENRIALDAAAITLKHIRVDKNQRYIETMDGPLNTCLNLEANLDQTGREFRHDLVFSMLDEGCAAVIPVETDRNPYDSDSYKIYQLRVAKVLEWMPEHVRIKLYNARTGKQQELVVDKRIAAIVPNPFYAVMNEPSSTFQRLVHKLGILDAIDEQSGSGKLDLIIQLPYQLNSEKRKKQAQERRLEIESQLSGSKYGIAYTDGTEHVTQLNRSVENNLLKQIEYLTQMVYNELGLDPTVMNQTADEKVMQNYENRILEPILEVIAEEFTRKFLSPTARTQGQVITFFRDPFRLIPVTSIAEMADKLTRNEIMTSNEVRSLVGLLPSKDPSADELRNKNLSESKQAIKAKQGDAPPEPIQNERSPRE